MLEQDAYEQIKKRILLGKYPMGAVLSEVAIADELEMSRTPVRSALNRLYCEGFINQKKGHFSTVRTVTPKDIHNFFQFSYIIQEYALRKIYEQPDAFDVSVLEQAVDQQEKALVEGDVLSYFGNQHTYHMALIGFLGNEEISRTLENMWEKIMMLSYPHSLANKNYWDKEKTIAKYRDICRALREREPLETVIDKMNQIDEDARNRLLFLS